MATLKKSPSFLTGDLIQQACEAMKGENLSPVLAQTLSWIQQFPHDPASWRLRGLCLYKAGDPQEAAFAFEESLHLDPHNLYTMANLAFAYLSLGRYEEGWDLCEKATQDKRKKIEQQGGIYWQGEPTADLTLFAEEGWGDSIQFLRFVSLLGPLVSRLHGVVPQRDVSLFQALKGEDFPSFETLVSLEETPEWQIYPGKKYVFLSSLPFIFGVSLPQLPASVPYLRPFSGGGQEESLALEKIFSEKKERDRNKPKKPLRVGLVWAGREDQGHDYSRSCPPSFLEPLSQISGVHWVSLQKGPLRNPFPTSFETDTFLTPSLSSWKETMQVMKELDLIISVDTAVAHLAGAMGKPTWLMHSFSPDWRWMHEKETSLWYPTVRIFRQPKPHDWSSVVAEIGRQLEALTKGEAPVPFSQKRALHHTALGHEDYAGFLWQQALAEKPGDPLLHEGLAQWYETVGDLESAQHQREKAFLHDREVCPEMLLRQGALFLKRGAYEQGFQFLAAGVLSVEKQKEWLDFLRDPQTRTQPLLLRGTPSLPETLALLRFLPLAHQVQGHPLHFYGPKPLCRLLEKTTGVAQSFSLEEEDPTFPSLDMRALPFLLSSLGAEKENSKALRQEKTKEFPFRVPYINPPEEALKIYGRRQIPGFNIGIGWRGEEGDGVNFQEFMPFFFFPEINWVNLDTTEDPYAYTAPILRLHPPLKEYGDLAAFLVSTIDLVITSDIGLAHLSGALGIPVWVILPPSKGHWSWGESSEGSPWYPSARLFFQRRHDNLRKKCVHRPLTPHDTVFTSVYQELEKLMKNKFLMSFDL